MRTKICCVISDEEVDAAVAAGAAAVGFVPALANKPSSVSDAAIHRMAARVPVGVHAVALTPLTHADAILAHHGRLPVQGLQLVNAPDVGELQRLRRRRPPWRIWQSVHVQGPECLEVARAVAPWVDGLVLDSGRSGEGALGGTGAVHDWTLRRRIREALPDTFLWLAGGLRPGNVEAAVRAVHPDGVDVCSGVRAGRRLDARRLAWFTRGARAAGEWARGSDPDPPGAPSG